MSCSQTGGSLSLSLSLSLRSGGWPSFYSRSPANQTQQILTRLKSIYMVGKKFHTLIKNVSFSSQNDVGSYKSLIRNLNTTRYHCHVKVDLRKKSPVMNWVGSFRDFNFAHEVKLLGLLHMASLKLRPSCRPACCFCYRPFSAVGHAND